MRSKYSNSRREFLGHIAAATTLIVNPGNQTGFIKCGDIHARRVALTSRESSEWQEDLRYMAAEMPKYHKNLYHAVSAERFAAMVIVCIPRFHL